MKVLVLTQFFDPTRGGGEIMFYQLVSQLGKWGHRIFVVRHKILISDSSKNNLDDLSSNVVLYDVEPAVEHRGGLPAGLFQNVLYVLNSIKTGLKIIKSNRVDLIHCNTYSPVFAGLFLSKLTGVPLLVTVHDVASLHGYNFWMKWMEQFGRLSRIKALIGYVTELLTIKLSKNIHTVSETSKKDILSFNSKCNVFVIPNSLDLECYGLREDITYGDFILFIGRLIFYKHLEVVIKALKLLKNRCNVRLVVLGDGPMRSKWEELVDKLNLKDMVEFKGYVSHREKLYYLSKCRALVLPSIFEGFGIGNSRGVGIQKTSNGHRRRAIK
jgi:glycosyltransferase involved in cell wall biosynthesis